MRAASYTRAAEPLRRRCLLQWLEPLSVGHVHLLGSIESPFFPDAWRAEAQDLSKLVEAVFILAQPYDQAKRSLRSRWTAWKMLAWGKLAGRYNPFFEREILREHILEGTALPKTWSTNSREMGCPGLLTVYQHLRWSRGLSEAETMDYPFARAMWDFLGHQEWHGRVQVLNATEQQLIEMMRHLPTKPAPEQKPAMQWPEDKPAEGQTNAV